MVYRYALATLTLLLAFVCNASPMWDPSEWDDSRSHDILVQTGDVDGAGTDARVSVKLYDAQGRMIESTDFAKDDGNMAFVEKIVDSKTRLRVPYNYFERNRLDSFRIDCFKCPTSKICKLELSHNNGGENPGWYVEYFRVQTKYPGDIFAWEDTKFEINRWLAKDEPPYSLSVQIDLC